MNILSSLKTSVSSVLGELSEKRIDLIQSTVPLWADGKRATMRTSSSSSLSRQLPHTLRMQSICCQSAKWDEKVSERECRDKCEKDPVRPNGGTFFSAAYPITKVLLHQSQTQQLQQGCIIENLINGSLTTASEMLMVVKSDKLPTTATTAQWALYWKSSSYSTFLLLQLKHNLIWKQLQPLRHRSLRQSIIDAIIKIHFNIWIFTHYARLIV